MQRVQGFQYQDLVAARCKSHLTQKVSEHERAHKKSHNTKAADTESRTNDDYMHSERERITTTLSIICLFIRDTQSHHPISQIQYFIALYKSQPLIQRRGPRPKAHWYMSWTSSEPLNPHIISYSKVLKYFKPYTSAL